jgi:hypothetical protein
LIVAVFGWHRKAFQTQENPELESLGYSARNKVYSNSITAGFEILGKEYMNGNVI